MFLPIYFEIQELWVILTTNTRTRPENFREILQISRRFQGFPDRKIIPGVRHPDTIQSTAPPVTLVTNPVASASTLCQTHCQLTCTWLPPPVFRHRRFWCRHPGRKMPRKTSEVSRVAVCTMLSKTWPCKKIIQLPYILAYKPTIFGWILRTKLWGSAYTRVMPHSHTLADRVSAAWTICRPLGLRVGVGANAAGGGTTRRLLLLHTR